MELKDIVRVTIKPIMKEAGFKTKGNDWWKRIEGGLLMMHLKKSFFSNAVNGFMWDFLMFVVPEKEIGNNINDIWIDHQSDCLEIKYLLPYYGCLIPQMDGFCSDFQMFVPDRSKQILKGRTVEETNEIVRNVFEEYVVPFLSRCNRVEDWHELETEARANTPPEIRDVLSFFRNFVVGGGYEKYIPKYLEEYRRYGLNRKLIEENYALLEKMYDKENSEIRKIMGSSYCENTKKNMRDIVERVVCLAETSEANESASEA